MKKTNVTLIIFTLMSFVNAMTAFVFNGILDKVSFSLNISVANSGLLNTMYAYGAAFGVPITLILFRKIERIKMLKIMLCTTILTTLALVIAQNFAQLLIIRFLMGVSANSYGVLATSTVLALSTKERQGRSLAFLIMGASLALVIGIPLTRVLSDLLDWRSIFLVLIVIMIGALIYFQSYLPEGNHESTKLNLRAELKFFKDRKTLLVLIYSIVMFIGYGAFYNYVTPYLIILFPSIESMMSFILVLLGLASFTGNLIGGYVADRIGYAKSLLLGAVLQLAFMLLIFVCQNFMGLSIIFSILWLMSSWFTGLQLNTGIAEATENKSSLIISLNSSAIQLGTAIGSSFAARAISINGIENIVFITLITSLAITIIQIFSLKNSQQVLFKSTLEN